jgi:hypothetical protein
MLAVCSAKQPTGAISLTRARDPRIAWDMHRIRSLSRGAALCVLALVPLACDATAERGAPGAAAAGAGMTPGEDSQQELPAHIECSVFFRESNELGEGDDPTDPRFQHQERTLRAAPDEDASSTLGRLTFDLHYSVSEQEGSSVHVAVTAGEQRLVSCLYQLGHAGVRNQFVGDHGFTGLVHLTHPTEGGDYQLICHAR